MTRQSILHQELWNGYCCASSKQREYIRSYPVAVPFPSALNPSCAYIPIYGMQQRGCNGVGMEGEELVLGVHSALSSWSDYADVRGGMNASENNLRLMLIIKLF